MITQAEPRCDVCGNYFLFDPNVNYFRITGIEQELFAHDQCVEHVKNASKNKDWKLLPDGPLRQAIEGVENSIAAIRSEKK